MINKKRLKRFSAEEEDSLRKELERNADQLRDSLTDDDFLKALEGADIKTQKTYSKT